MFNKLTVAISAALISSSAYAINPTVTPDIEIFMSGASAQDKSIEALFGSICLDAPDSFRDNANPSKPGKAHTAFFCTIDSSQIVNGTSVTNPTVLFHKRSAGGSAQGVNPVISAVAIDAMDINNGNCTETPVGSGEWLCTINNPGDIIQQVSDAGVSDVNPEMFVGVNTPSGSQPVDPALVAANMEVRGAAALVFGIPVTTNLRDALQEVQGLVIGDDGEANMPTLSKSQVASLMQGVVSRWDNFKVNGVSLSAAVANPPADGKVNICRRVNGSGTQAQMNAKFLNYPCTAGAAIPRAAPGNPFLGPVITENSGSGDVSICLNNANAANQWAVGIQSTEKNSDLADDYRFIKIDYMAPTLVNAARGAYLDVVEQTYQWRKAAVNGVPSLAGDKLNIVETIATNAGSPAILAAVVNPGANHVWGQSGYMALSSNGFAISSPFNPALPVTPFSHAAAGPLDNCVAPVASGNFDL